MSSSNLRVNMQFTADTHQASQQLQALQRQLSSLINQPVGVGDKITNSIQQATVAAAELKVHLQEATNVKTGTLDFGKLNNSLKQSGTSIADYGAKLQALGPRGQKAFMSLASSVAAAEVPMRRTSAAMNDLFITLKNTAKWQLSSNLMHGFVGSIQRAYGYAQDLNESLNNIRIVTGQNVDQMARFATEANKAARALSTTTTEYTNASLIYYQQGLSDQQVKQRTDITIKMANAARQSAEIVSDQLTAVWNNFYDGSKSLEYYADVMTALGAATASSTDEISEGLNKFAAVAQTVGLSYEYATAALATITSNTRESADVVGNALKTLFARIQGLQLGETLDDGTNLNKYSEALGKVGISIYDANGELKSMDQTLTEMASKWETLTGVQQVALAQTIAGVRQYNQLIALMENWNVGDADSMVANLQTAKNASGALQKQADIYAESWEAASARVKAASEKIYASLFDDKFFIKLTDTFAGLIDSVGGFVDSIGGLGGVLSGLGLIITKVFDKQIAQGFRNVAYNIKMSTEAGRLAVQQQKKQAMDTLASQMARSEASGLEEETAKSVYVQELDLQTELIANADRMSAAEQQKFKILLDQQRAYGQQSLELAKQIELLKEQQSKAAVTVIGTGLNNSKSIREMTQAMQQARDAGEDLGIIEHIFANIGRSGEVTEENILSIKNALTRVGATKKQLQDLNVAFDQLEDNGKQATSAMDQVRAVMSSLNTNIIKDILNTAGIEQDTEEYKHLTSVLERYISTIAKIHVEEKKLEANNHNLQTSFVSLKDEISRAGVNLKDWATHLTGFSQGLMSAGTLITSFNSLMKTISNPDVSGWEKFGAVLSSVSMIMMSLSGSWKGLISLLEFGKIALNKETLARLANAVATAIQAKASRKTTNAKKAEERQTEENTEAINKETAAKAANKAIEFKGKNGKTRTYSGRTNARGQFVDDDGQIISNKYVEKYELQKFGKADDTTATTAVSTGTKKLLNPGTLKTLAGAAGGAAIVAASIAGAALAISTASDYYNRHAIEAEKATEAAQRLAKSYDDIKTKESSFRESISGYSDAVNGLESLTKGTTEYKEAIMQANEQALALLKTNEDLSYIIDNKTGLIKIDEEELERAQAASLKKERLAQMTMLSAEQNAKNKQLEADRVKFNRTQAKSGVSTLDSDDLTILQGGGAASAALITGAGGISALMATGALTNAWNPVGWALGIASALTLAGTLIVSTVNNDAQKIEDAALTNIAEKREELGRDLTDIEIKDIAKLYDSTGKLGDSLAGTTEALKSTNDMAKAINENTAALRANSELILSQEFGSAAAEWLVDTYDSKYSQSRAELEQLNKDINRFEDLDAGSEATEMINRYMNATGKRLNWDYHVAAGTDQNREFIYYDTDDEGNRVEKRISANDMIEEIAVAEALKNQEQQAFLVNEMLSRIESEQGQNIAEALASWTTTKSLDSALTMNSFTAMQNAIDSAGGAQGYLTSIYGMDIEQMAQELGYGSGALLLESFEQAIADKEQEFKNVSKIIPEAMREEFIEFTDTLFMGELDANTQANIASSLTQAYVTGGETGYQMMERILGNATNSEEVKELSAVLSSLNWENATPESLTEKLDELGIQTNLTTSELEALIDLMSDGIIRLNHIGETYNDLTSAITDLSLTQEEYLQASELGLGHYFTRMYDGTYQLIGGVEDFEQVLRDLMQLDYVQTLEVAKKRLEEIQKHQETTQTNLTALGLENYDTVNKNISTQAVFDDYSNKVVMGADGQATTTKHTDATYKQVSEWVWDIPLLWGHAETKSVVDQAAKDETKAIDDNLVQTYMDRIDYIEAMNIVGSEMIEQWRTSTDMAKTEQEILTNYLPQAMEAHKELASLDEIQKAAILEAEEALLSTAEDSEERKALYESEGMNDQSYAKAVNAAITQEAWEGLDQEAVAEYADYLEDSLGIAEEGAEEAARAITKMNQGVETLNSNWEEWSSILKKSEKTSEEYSKAMQGTRKALSDVLDVSEEFIRVDFVEAAENLELIGKAAKGDAKAIDALGYALAEDIAKQAIDIGDVLTVDGIEYTGQEAIDKVGAMMDAIQAEISGANLTLGENIDTGPIFTKLQEVVTASQMTAEQANAFYRSMGFTPHFKMVDAVQAESVPLTNTYHSRKISAYDEHGNPTDWVETEYSETTQVPGGELHSALPSLSIETADGKMPQVPSTQIESVTYTGGGSFNNRSSSNKGGKGGGGGGGSKKPAEKPKKSDIVERYKEVNDLLDDVADAMEDASKAADRLYGKGRLDLMKKNNDLLKQEIELTKQKKKEALEYLDEDLNAMFKAAADAGVILTTDENGLISNYTEVMTELYNELDAEVTKANRDGNASESEQARIDKIQERIDALKDAMKQYDETRELIEDLDNELDEKFYQWQDNNYEMLTYELEIKLELNEDELKLIDYYLNKISDDFYQMAEAAALMVGGSDGVSQLEMYTSNLSNYEEHVNSLKEAYANGEISQAAYIEGLREAQDEMLSNLESLNDLDETMMHYYGETLSMAAEELAKYTDHMEHLTEVLDHYQSLMEIMGKSTDYEAMGLVLEGKAKALGDQAAVAKATMEMYKDEAEDRYQAYQQALLDGDEAAAELYLQQYRDALAAADEAEQEYLANAEEWAEALTAVLENKLSNFGQTLENALTGGTSFDQMTTAMERAASLQEEYLTTTNKIYETNKLMRQAQQEIDKTSNTAAKRRLQNFIEETNQLQNQAQLSNYELEIQQAKYDLLLAEIALEEAQNAKSIVRLQRDSEGNFGYVYTADGAAVSEAEQNMLDKQNNLYNIALQGANDYSQKYQQTLNEMYSTLTDLQQQYLEGAFESEEEYHAAVEAAKKYYYDKLQQYSSLHTVAITLDSRVINDAWSAGFNDMLTKTEEWMEAVDIYLDDVGVAFMEWSEYMDQIAADTGTDLDSLEKNVKDITDESKALKDILIGEDGKGGVVGAIKTEIEAVKDITESYATLRAELAKIKAAYEEVATAINATIRAQSQISSNPGTSTTKYNSSSGGKQGSASEGASSGGSGGGPGTSGAAGNGADRNKKAKVTLYGNRGGNYLGVQEFTKGEFTAVALPGKALYNHNVYNNTTKKGGFISEQDYKILTSLDTGGYTGKWGPYGKLAMLHEKELILNKGDTENFLASMEVLERILQVIDLHSASSQIGGILSSPILGNTGSQDINQHISIEASFPNATDRFEIEEAFKSMANLASQYANRK